MRRSLPVVIPHSWSGLWGLRTLLLHCCTTAQGLAAAPQLPSCRSNAVAASAASAASSGTASTITVSPLPCSARRLATRCTLYGTHGRTGAHGHTDHTDEPPTIHPSKPTTHNPQRPKPRPTFSVSWKLGILESGNCDHFTNMYRM